MPLTPLVLHRTQSFYAQTAEPAILHPKPPKPSLLRSYTLKPPSSNLKLKHDPLKPYITSQKLGTSLSSCRRSRQGGPVLDETAFRAWHAAIELSAELVHAQM